jgi:hypothetical protein
VIEFKSTIDLRLADRKITEGAEDGLSDAAAHVLAVSNERVPTESGALRASGRVTADGLTSAVSYGTAYATIQHEDLTLHHDNGQPKFLESGLTGDRSEAATRIAAGIRRRT